MSTTWVEDTHTHIHTRFDAVSCAAAAPPHSLKGLQPVQEVQAAGGTAWEATGSQPGAMTALLQAEVCSLQGTTDMRPWLDEVGGC